jgi:predicted TIM-barrel fold metal-dependent hydrolase
MFDGGKVMRKIDFRCRPIMDIPGWSVDGQLYDVAVCKRLEDQGATPGREPAIPIEEFFRALDENDIAAGVMVGRDVESTFGIKVPNEEIAALADKYPGRLYGFAGIDGNKRMEAVREIDHLVKLGIKGIAVDGWLQRMDLDDRNYYPIYAKCVEHDIPVIFTACIPVHLAPRIYPSEGQHPHRVDRIACDFPELKIVITHAGVPWYLEYQQLARKHPTLHFEIHGDMIDYLGIDIMIKTANSYLQDQMLYSSSYPWGKLDSFKKLEGHIKDEVAEKFYYKNAARLLGLES